ncbi:MAG: Fic family protein [Deltaproteobacteria bacterium]|nr:Fic family protein [Deltaproteobacteria bacterium]
MRRIITYIYDHPHWPHFQWNQKLSQLLAEVRHQQGRLMGRMESLGFDLQIEATLRMLTLDVVTTSEIEGQILNTDQVRSSICRRLGIDRVGLVPADRNVDGIVEVMLDATQNYKAPLTKKRLFGWHAALFPTGYSGMYQIKVGKWRNHQKGPMQVVSGPLGREHIHFEAPDASRLNPEMKVFFDWFNSPSDLDPVIKSAIAHLWFITIHPFDDGNGRLARAIADMQLARSDSSKRRFYSMSAQIKKERKIYYKILEQTQKGTLDITVWLDWYLSCLCRALLGTEQTLMGIIHKAHFWNTHRTQPVNARQQLVLNKLLDGFEGKLTSSKWAKIAKCSQDTALRDIQDLIDHGLLIKESTGGRSTSYALKQPTKYLDS